MAYSRGIYSRVKGDATHLDKTQIFVSNSLGNCEVMVYDTGDYNGTSVFVSFHFDADTGTGTLVWPQYWDNGETSKTGRAVVKRATFTVSGGAVTGLPTAASTVFRAATTPFGFADVELSQDGARLAISAEDTSNGYRRLRVVVCDMPACSNPQSAFQATNDGDLSQIGGTFELAFGRSELDGAERIYFFYRRPAPWSAGDLVMIENHAGTWTSPIALLLNDDYLGDLKPTALREPSVFTQPGVADRIVLTSQDGYASANPLRIDVYEVGSNSLVRNVGIGYGPSWTIHPSIDSTPPNILVNNGYPTQSMQVLEIDQNGTPETLLSVSGYGVDSAN